jgi:uncharacterized membrane protein
MSEISYPSEEIVTGARRGDRHPNGQRESWMKSGSSFGSIVAGSALAVYGVTRRSAGGTALAAAGGLLAVRGIRRAVAPGVAHVESSFTINRPVSEVYNFFRSLENLPKFMRHLRLVHATGAHTSHWVARAPLGLELEWDAEILQEEPNRYLVWHTLPGAMIPNRGSVQFSAASEYHGGCEITVAVDYAPPGGRGAALFARIFGRDPGVQLREDLRRLKQLLEAGEIATTEGQPHGRRTAFVRMIKAVQESPGGGRIRHERPWAVVS